MITQFPDSEYNSVESGGVHYRLCPVSGCLQFYSSSKDCWIYHTGDYDFTSPKELRASDYAQNAAIRQWIMEGTLPEGAKNDAGRISASNGAGVWTHKNRVIAWKQLYQAQMTAKPMREILDSDA